MKKKALLIVALLVSSLSLITLIWVLVPAQSSFLWLVSILASEWSLFFGFTSLLGLALGVWLMNNDWMIAGALAVLFGVPGIGISLYPLISVQEEIKQWETRISFKRYVLGSNLSKEAPKTYTYSEVDGRSIKLDVYGEDDGMGDARPAIVIVHGGAWRGGGRSDFPEWNYWLVEQGFVVFDIDYRLRPQPNWNTATQDVQQAVRWIKERADAFGVDSDKMALMGRSAGGHLVLQAAYTAVNDTTTNAPTVQAVIALYPPTDLEWGYHNPANQKVIDGPAVLRGVTGGTPVELPDIYAKASPIYTASKESPATLLVHGGHDQLVLQDHAEMLKKRLDELAPEKHHYLYLPYAQHGFDYRFDGWGSQILQPVLLWFLEERW